MSAIHGGVYSLRGARGAAAASQAGNNTVPGHFAIVSPHNVGNTPATAADTFMLNLTPGALQTYRLNLRSLYEPA